VLGGESGAGEDGDTMTDSGATGAETAAGTAEPQSAESADPQSAGDTADDADPRPSGEAAQIAGPDNPGSAAGGPDAGGPPPAPPDTEEAATTGAGPTADAGAQGDVDPEPAEPRTESAADQDPTANVDRTTVRITRDVGEIVGVDEQVYTLESEDVVALPETNAKPLLDREAAEQLDGPDPA
jgi:DNA replication factor GINS